MTESLPTVGPGRPRLAKQRRAGRTPRAEILDAAAELFTEHGYGNTSTRGIADAVGMRQASLYHHFAAKDDILDALLDETVASALVLATALVGAAGPAGPRLYALAWFDAEQLHASTWNMGALYLLPELRTPRFEQFRHRRDTLRDRYEELAAAVIAESGPDGIPGAEVLPFRLVETVINMRSDGGAMVDVGTVIPDAALRLLGWRGAFPDLRATAAPLRGL